MKGACINLRNLLLVVLGMCASNVTAKDRLTADSLLRRISYQIWSFPQEKIYVTTDKDAYISGDTIRFRAFLVDASSHMTPKLESKYIYIDLIDPFGYKVNQVKIMKKDGAFAGLLPLDSDIPEGCYTFSAHTQFMRNAGKDYFFRKPIPIFSQLSRRYRLDVRTENGNLKANLYERGSDLPVKVENISVMGRDHEILVGGIRKRSEYSMKISDKMLKSGYILAKFDKYEKFVPIHNDNSTISVSFHPEGGYLISDVENRLAFKALDSNGLSKEIKGYIVNDSGDTVCTIQSVHSGMGMVEMTPKSNKSYTAIINDQHIALPIPESHAEVISVNSLGSDSIVIRKLGNGTGLNFLIVHNGGIVSHILEMPENEVRISRNSLGSGIIQLLLADEFGDIKSSRMIFNHKGYVYAYAMDSIPEGDYSVSASVRARSDSTYSIVSGLLLQSELKGFIEDPDYYFRQRDSVTDYHLDLLMLTQGWKRYDLQSALKNDFYRPEIPLEIGGEITGTVKSRWKGKPLKNASVMLISPKLNFADQVTTDAEGRFTFNGLDWPDHTVFSIQVLGKNGDKEHNFSLDQEEDPVISPIQGIEKLVSIDYMVDYDILTSGTIMLDELVVTASMGSEQARREMLGALGVKCFTSKELEDKHITSYEELIRKIPGLRVVNGNLVSAFSKASILNSGGAGSPVEYWVDGFQWNPYSSSHGGLKTPRSQELVNAPLGSEQLRSISMHNTLKEFESAYPIHIIESIEYYRPSNASMISIGAANGGGALVVTTKDGSSMRDWDADLFLRSFKPFGYQNIPDAYKPYFVYDPTYDEGVYQSAWFPHISKVDSLSNASEMYVVLEGLMDGYIPVLIRKTNNH